MTSKEFVINDRYRVYPALNQVRDYWTGLTTRLEPRLMAVLMYLSGKEGQLVSRQEIVEDIWDNYGGGDEALSQAISLLRKVLGDNEKKLICTIPKKGYCFTGDLSAPSSQKLAIKRPSRYGTFRLGARYATVLYVAVTAFYFIFNMSGPSTTTAPVAPSLVTAVPKALMETGAIGEEKIVQINKHDKQSALAANRADRLEKAHSISASMAKTPARVPGQTISETYHSNDMQDQVSIALDYRMAATFDVSTSLE